MPKHVLIVDDDRLLSRSVAFNLEKVGFTTTIAGSAEEALTLLQGQRPSLILLDIGLPGMDGIQAIQAIKQAMDVPIILLTAHRRAADEIVGLESGADDYITKPFDNDMLVAHIHAILRRSVPTTPALPVKKLTAGNLSIDPLAHTVKIGEREVELAPKEFDLLLTLAEEVNHVLSVETLLSRIWGPNWIGETQTLYVHVRWLREKLELDPNHPHRLLTVKGVGYKLVPITE